MLNWPGRVGQHLGWAKTEEAKEVSLGGETDCASEGGKRWCVLRDQRLLHVEPRMGGSVRVDHERPQMPR